MIKWLFTLFVLWPSLAFGATAYIGDNTTGTPVMSFAGTDDTWLQETTPTTARGTQTTFQITQYGASDRGTGVIKFTGLSNITGPVTVTSATLFINQQSFGTGNATIVAQRSLRAWVEAQATWNVYATASNWGTAGALLDGTDRSATISCSMTVTLSVNTYYGCTGTQLANDVEAFINGTLTNDGWILTGGAVGDFKQFYSSESATTNVRPYLEVTYTAPGGGGSSQVRHRVSQ